MELSFLSENINDQYKELLKLNSQSDGGKNQKKIFEKEHTTSGASW
jgi:hypothetical protein